MLIAEKLTRFAKLGGKPILASWMGGAEAAQGEAVLNRAGIPTFPFPDTAVRAFHYMWKYSYNLRAACMKLPRSPAPTAWISTRAEAIVERGRGNRTARS